VIAEFIGVEDLRWKRFLERTRHDFFHLPEYVALASKYEGGKAAAFYAEENGSAFLAPILIRDLPSELDAPDGWCDATTPYGYPTPIFLPSDDSDSFERFLEAFQDKGAEQGIITIFFRLHPLLELPQTPLARHGTLVKHGQTISLDLSLPHEVIWRQVRHDHRADICKLERMGFEVTFDDWSRLDDFVEAYWSTMKRVSADDFYLFPECYFADLRTALGSTLHLCTVLSPEGELASAGLFTETGQISQGYLAGTNEKYLREAPSKLAIYSEAMWAKEAGNLTFHLGGGVGSRADSLFDFKAGFSKLRSDFFTFRMVLNESAYAALLSSTSQGDQTAGDHTVKFPPYRNPQPRADIPALAPV
jgi:hypothetical protein